MPEFFPQVERWRSLVTSMVQQHLEVSSVYTALLQKLGKSSLYISEIILAIIQKESSGNEKATGDNGCSIGLMQLNWCAGTPQGMGYKGTKENLYDPQENIFWGSLYFFKQLNRYGDIEKAVSAYNAGHFTVTNQESYTDKVLRLINEKKTT